MKKIFLIEGAVYSPFGQILENRCIGYNKKVKKGVYRMYLNTNTFYTKVKCSVINVVKS